MAVRAFKRDIIRISGPVHGEHLSAMQKSRKIVVRDSLWYKKYRFKVIYRATSDFKQDTVPNIVAYKKNLTKDEIKLSNNIYRILQAPKQQIQTKYQGYVARYRNIGVHPWHTCTVYLDTEDNYVMYKMMVGGEIESEQEILLLSELESDK